MHSLGRNLDILHELLEPLCQTLLTIMALVHIRATTAIRQIRHQTSRLTITSSIDKLVRQKVVVLTTDLHAQCQLGQRVIVRNDVLPHSKALTDSQVVGQGTLLDLDAKVNHGHVCIVKRLQHCCLPKVQLLKLDALQIGIHHPTRLLDLLQGTLAVL